MEKVNCAICDMDDTKRILIKNSFNIVRCKSCGLIYINPRPTEEELINFYSSKSDRDKSYQKINGDRKNIEKLKNRLNIIEKFSENRGNILDIGCSTGLFLKMARDVGWEVYGNDIDEDKIKYAKENYGLDVQCRELMETKFPDDYFDVVTLFDSLEHMSKPLNTLKEISRILNQNGFLLLSTPNIGGLLPRLTYTLFARTIGAWEHPAPPAHLYQFSKRTIKRLLGKAGYKVIKLITEPIPFKYTMGKLENAIVDALKERRKKNATQKISSNLNETITRHQYLKSIPRKIVRETCCILVGLVYSLAKLLKRQDSMLVIASKKEQC